VNANGLWRVADGLEQNYRIFVNRDDDNDVMSVTVRLIDPIGRVTERLHTIEAGSIIPLPTLSPIDVFTISGRGTVYSSTTNAPLGSFGGRSYRVRATLTPPRDPINELVLRGPGRGPRIRPRPGPIIDIGIGRPRSQFRTVGRNLVFEGDLASVPTARPGESPEGSFAIVRQGTPSATTLNVFARKALSSVRLDIITPDGREVSRSTRG
jgi:hypothetical protein